MQVKDRSKIKKGRGAQVQLDNRFDKQVYEPILSDDLEEQPQPVTKYVSVHPKTIVNAVQSPDIPFQYSLNPYQGCEHGCVYCYARNSHEFWGYNAGLDFERFILVKKNAAELLEQKLLRKNWTAEPISLSGNTDCYQPVEQKLKITRSLLEVFLRYRHPVGIITKNAMILRDLDLLEALAKDQLVRVAISITGVDEGLRSKMEPRTTTFARRLDTVRKLSERGIPVIVMMAPVIPALNSDDIIEVAKRSANAGALDVRYIPVRLNGRLAEVFEDWLLTHYPDRADKVLNQIRSMHGGKLNDSRFGTRMRGEGKLATIISQQMKIARKLYFSGRKIPDYNKNLFHKGQLNLF